jgi:hypothetical protein
VEPSGKVQPGARRPPGWKGAAPPPYTARIACDIRLISRRLAGALVCASAGLSAPLVGGGRLPSTTANSVVVGPWQRAAGGATKSQNWAGYALTGKAPAFTTVQSSWIVPTATCSSTAGTNASIWAGLGTGVASSTLFQTGVAVNCVSGSPQYLAWWEEFPINFEQDYPDPVTPGDTMHAQVTIQAGSAALVLSDTGAGATPKWSETTTVTAPTAAVSAECITERPTVDGALGLLTDFGAVQISGCDATLVAKGHPSTAPVPNGPKIARTKATAFTMVGKNKKPIVTVTTTKGAADGDFAATWHAAS